MKAYRIRAVMMRHLYEARRNLDRVVDMVYWPVLDVVVWGFFTLYLVNSNRLQPSMFGFLLGATILWGMFYSFQRDLAVGFLDELWSRNLVNLFSTPLTVWEYVLGLIAVNLVKVMVAVAASALLAKVLYAFNAAPLLIAFIPFMATLMIFALALGIVITGLIFRYTTKIQGLAWSFAGLLQPVSCVFYPVASLPRMLRPVAWSLPTTYAFEGMRQILSGGGFSMKYFWWAMGLDVLYFALALALFKALFEQTRNRGLLVKLE